MCDESFVPKPYAGQQGGSIGHPCMCKAGHHCHKAVFKLGKANDMEPTKTHGDVSAEPITLIHWLLTRIIQEQDLNSCKDERERSAMELMGANRLRILK